MILRQVVCYVLSLGMYLSAYPEVLSSGMTDRMKSKHPEGRKGRLGDERIYRGKWTDPPRLSRYKLDSGYEFGAGKTVGVVPVEP